MHLVLVVKGVTNCLIMLRFLSIAVTILSYIYMSKLQYEKKLEAKPNSKNVLSSNLIVDTLPEKTKRCPAQ